MANNSDNRKQWYRDNKEHQLELTKDYRNRNKDYIKAFNRLRRGLKRLDPETDAAELNQLQLSAAEEALTLGIRPTNSFYIYPDVLTPLNALEFYEKMAVVKPDEKECEPVMVYWEDVEEHEVKVEEPFTIQSLINKKIPDSCDVYNVRITAHDLRQLVDILQTPAADSTYHLEVIDNRVRITSIYDKAVDAVKQTCLNLGVNPDDIRGFLPQIKAVAEEVSRSARVV